MITPNFPYTNNQIILSSDRVLLHSKSEGIFLFGKQMVSLSSTQTINLDADEKILLDCPKIELGHKAEKDGEPLLLGKKTANHLITIITALQKLASKLQTVSETGVADSWINIHEGGNILFSACDELLLIIKDEKHPQNPLSKNTFTI